MSTKCPVSIEVPSTYKLQCSLHRNPTLLFRRTQPTLSPHPTTKRTSLPITVSPCTGVVTRPRRSVVVTIRVRVTASVGDLERASKAVGFTSPSRTSSRTYRTKDENFNLFSNRRIDANRENFSEQVVGKCTSRRRKR